MSNKRKLLRELRKTLDVKQDVPNYISGILGAVISGEELVAVPERNGFVYVRLRNSESEFIQAFNETVNNVYGLPVLLEYDKHYYKVVGKDTNRYSQWGSGYGGAQLAAHGDQHSFGEGSNTGTDIVWVYKRQFMPLLVKPTNPFSMSVSVEDDWYQWNNELKHYTGTTIDLTAAKPGDGYSRFITLYVDATTNTTKGVTGSNFISTNYGASVETYIPTVSQLIGIPVGSVRLDGGGTDLRWSNLYDIRSLWTGPSSTLIIYDDGIVKVTGTAIDFGAGLAVTTTGSVAYVSATPPSFLDLTDTPNSYSGQGGKFVRVNAGESALEFVTGSTSGSNPFTDPTSIGDCKLWLKADSITGKSNGDRLDIWYDSSGWLNHAVTSGGATVYNTNQINGKPAVYLTGTSSYLRIPAFQYSQEFSMFMVFELDSVAQAYNALYGYSVFASDEGGIFVKSNGKSALFLGKADANFWSYDGTGASTYVTGTWYLFDSIHGFNYFDTSQNAVADASGTASGYHVGGWYGSMVGNHFTAGRYFAGRIAEVLLYNRELSNTEIAAVRSYLNTKYSIY